MPANYGDTGSPLTGNPSSSSFAAVAAAQKAGGQVAMEPTEIPGHGTLAIYVQGGVDHGLWEK